MSSQSILSALSPEGSEQMPVVIPYEGIYLRDHYPKLFSVPWWYAFSLDMGRQKQYLREYMQAVAIDWYAPHLVRGTRFCSQHEMAIDADHLVYLNKETQQQMTINRPQIGGTGEERQDFHVTWEDREQDPDRIRAIAAENAFRLREEGEDRLLAWQQLLAADQKAPTGFVESPFESVFNIWGFTSTMLTLAENKPLVRIACEAYRDAALITIKTCADIGCKIIWVEECFSDLISPEDYRNLALPNLMPVIDAIRKAGLFSIYYFTGNPADKLDLICSIGADAYSFEDDKKGFHVDLPEIAERLINKAALLGNLNAILDLQDAGDEALLRRIDTFKPIARKLKGRFIMSLGSPVTPKTPVSRVNRYIDYVRDMGKL